MDCYIMVAVLNRKVSFVVGKHLRKLCWSVAFVWNWQSQLNFKDWFYCFMFTQVRFFF